MKNQNTYILILSLLVALCLIGCGTRTPEPDTSNPAPVESTESNTVTTKVKERGLCFSIEQEYLDKGVTLESSSENAKGYKTLTSFTTVPPPLPSSMRSTRWIPQTSPKNSPQNTLTNSYRQAAA